MWSTDSPVQAPQGFGRGENFPSWALLVEYWPFGFEWLQDRQAELLNTQFCHVVFTLPQQIATVAYGPFSIRCADPTDSFDYHKRFAIGLDAAGFYSFSLESSLQRAQHHSVNPTELAS
jgi:hypothetical protein